MMTTFNTYGKKSFALLVIGFIFCLSATAQQEIMLSQYMFNQMVINPGYAGSKNFISADALYRRQWVDFPGSPTTQTVSIHTPIGLTNMGGGLSVAHDNIGVTDRTDIYLNYAYHLKLNGNLKLGLGLRGGVSLFSARLQDLIYWDQDDRVFPQQTQNNTLPNFGTGAFLYNRLYYIGITIPNLLSFDPDRPITVNSNALKDIPHLVRHYYVTGGYVFEINRDFVLKPSTLLKYTYNAPVEVDINVNALLMEVLWVGVSYRTGDSFIGLVGFNITKQLRLGYAYDFTMTDIKDHSDGTHEVTLGYDFGYDIQKMKTPRYF
ncbi:MAG TPA: type IX secretion system membrane protein PorP/SprF [Bacteroidia bacterium]|nr:type IX secretion system membrane protein PorP/SprF [Bacteroidia bacterium]